MKMKSLIAGAALTVASSVSSAAVLDFIDLTENVLGESAWSTLSVNVGGVDVEITAGDGTKDGAYAYLDWGTAGLGVCSDAYSTGANPGSGTNQCNPGSDDNVTVDEYLTFTFLQDATINAFMFNNNHDEGFDATDMVTIDGVDYLTGILAPYSGQATINTGWSVLAGESVTVAFNNEQFYVSGLDVVGVPEPATVALMGLGLAGLGFARRRKA